MATKILTGTNEALLVDCEADSDGELAISMNVTACDSDAGSAHTWLNKGMAIALIKLLIKAFKITPNELEDL